jgi:hypothetical protein
MQATRIPPKLEPPKTTAGLPIGPRELAIVGPAFGLAVLIFFTGLPFFVRVGAAVALVGLAATYALARIEARYTIEEYLLNRLGFSGRLRRRVKGGGEYTATLGRRERQTRAPIGRAETDMRTAWFTIPAERVPASRTMLVNTIGLALLSAFLAWMGTGGLAELMELRASVMYVW